MATLPLEGIRVVELSVGLAGRLAGLLLADQGATVIVGRAEGESVPLDAFLDRGKQRHGDFHPASMASADIVIRDAAGAENRPPRQIRLTITAVLPGETDYPFSDEVGDDMLKAVMGIYTDLAVTRKVLGEDVVYTPLPLCSIYAGVLGALAVGAALVDRARRGDGRDIVVARLAAGLSAIGALALEIEGLPPHLNIPPIIGLPTGLSRYAEEARTSRAAFEWLKRRMNPFFACYPAADGRQVMPACVSHRRQARGLLEALGLWEEMKAAGVVDLSAYDPANAAFADHNIAIAQNLRLDLRMKVAELIEREIAREPAMIWEMRLEKAGIPCVMVRDFDEWRQSDQAREAALSVKVAGCDWPQLGRAVRLDSAKPYPALRLMRPAEDESAAASAAPAAEPPISPAPLSGVRVLDLANVIAGPACGLILAELGAEVIKVDTTRPDHAPTITALWSGELNQGKRSLLLDCRKDEGRRVLHKLAALADMIVFNKLDPVMARLGLDKQGLAKINPDAIAVQVTAFKGERPSSHDDFPGYDPVLQAATGITTRFGSADAPELHGLASCVDYATGYLAAFGATVALFARARRGGGGDWVDTSLASAATLMQMNFQASPASLGSSNCLRKARDGWICVEPADAAIGDVSELSVAEALKAAKASGVVAAAVQSIARLKEIHRNRPSATVAFRTERGGFPTVNIRPTWFHFDGKPLPEASPATIPGSDAAAILAELGYGPAAVERLIEEGTVGRPWWIPAAKIPIGSTSSLGSEPPGT